MTLLSSIFIIAPFMAGCYNQDGYKASTNHTNNPYMCPEQFACRPNLLSGRRANRPANESAGLLSGSHPQHK